MSHDSGFRRGGRDVARGGSSQRNRGGRSARKYEERMNKRFHEHERSEPKKPTDEGER